MAFRNPKGLESNQDIVVELETPLKFPDANVRQ